MIKGYNTENYTERALQLLEKDICYMSYANWGYAITPEDIQQELRYHLFLKIDKYHPGKKSLRTWAQQVMRNKLIDMRRGLHRNGVPTKRGFLDSDLRVHFDTEEMLFAESLVVDLWYD